MSGLGPRFENRLEKDGVPGVLKGGWRYLLRESVFAPALRSALGEPLHEQVSSVQFLGYWPRIRYPCSFNEKIMHRKLYTDEERFSVVADKWRVREYVENKVGDEILNEIYHVTDDPETIPFDSLPDRFVVKATHASGKNVLVTDKSGADPGRIKSICREWLDTEFGAQHKEYWYRRIDPNVIVENYITEPGREVPLDYKFLVFDGEVEYVDVEFDRFAGQKTRYFDREWRPQPFTDGYPLGPAIDEPDDLDEMIAISEKLADEFDFARVDLYNPREGEILFGEITLAPAVGWARFEPKAYDFVLGSHWKMDREQPPQLAHENRSTTSLG